MLIHGLPSLVAMIFSILFSIHAEMSDGVQVIVDGHSDFADSSYLHGTAADLLNIPITEPINDGNSVNPRYEIFDKFEKVAKNDFFSLFSRLPSSAKTLLVLLIPHWIIPGLVLCFGLGLSLANQHLIIGLSSLLSNAIRAPLLYFQLVKDEVKPKYSREVINNVEFSFAGNGHDEDRRSLESVKTPPGGHTFVSTVVL